MTTRSNADTYEKQLSKGPKKSEITFANESASVVSVESKEVIKYESILRFV